MNKQEQRNKISRMLRTSNRNRNVLRWGKGETRNHIYTSLRYVCS